MDFSIASILALDGVTNGAIYALLALATVLVAVTLGVIVLGESLTLGLVLGFPVVLAGCWLAGKRDEPMSELDAEAAVAPV